MNGKKTFRDQESFSSNLEVSYQKSLIDLRRIYKRALKLSYKDDLS